MEGTLFTQLGSPNYLTIEYFNDLTEQQKGFRN